MPDPGLVRLAGEHIDAQLSSGQRTLLVAPGQRDASALRTVMSAAACWTREHVPGSITIDAQFAREVKSALEDAADYRSDGGGPDACADCTTERPCHDHDVDAALAAMYLMRRDELDGALDGGQPPGLPGALAKLRDACDGAGWTFATGTSYDSDLGLWDAEVTLYHDPDGASGPRTATVVETGGALNPVDALIGTIRAALRLVPVAPEVIEPGAFRNLPADVPFTFGRTGGPRIGRATVTHDGTGLVGAVWIDEDMGEPPAGSFRIPDRPGGEDKPHD